MRQGGIGKEPEYRRKQQEASEREQYAQHQEDVIRTVVSIRTSIDSMVTEHSANRKQADTHERGKRKRELSTFWALVVAAGAAILTLIVSHCDNRAIMWEAQRASGQQHADTLAALGKTETTITAMQTQASIMRGQLEEMKSSGEFAKAQLIAKMKLEIRFDTDVVNNTIDRWYITPTWTNVGPNRCQRISRLGFGQFVSF
jgi:hypothetical protein